MAYYVEHIFNSFMHTSFLILCKQFQSEDDDKFEKALIEAEGRKSL